MAPPPSHLEIDWSVAPSCLSQAHATTGYTRVAPHAPLGSDFFENKPCCDNVCALEEVRAGHHNGTVSPDATHFNEDAFFRNGIDPGLAINAFTNSAFEEAIDPATNFDAGDFTSLDDRFSTTSGMASSQDLVPAGQLTEPDKQAFVGLGSQAAFTGSVPFNNDFALQPILNAPALPQGASALSTQTRQPPQTGRVSGPASNRLSCTKPGCSVTFGRPAEFRRHVQTMHEQPVGGGFRCVYPTCNYTYPRFDKFRSHMKKMHGLRVEKI